MYIHMKLIYALLISFAIACYGPSAHAGPPLNPNWDDQGDRDAAEIQKLMQTVVTVHVKNVFKVPGPLPMQDSSDDLGSGFVLGHRDGHTLVMTAGHICHEEKFVTPAKYDGAKIPVLYVLYKLNDIDEVEHVATVVWTQPSEKNADDLCILDSPENFGKEVVLADRLPPQGARLVHIGSPLMNFDHHMRYVSEGRYGGLQNLPPAGVFETTSVPSAPGGSGGGVWYHGRLVGVMVMTAHGFGTISQAVTLDNIRNELGEVLKTWHQTTSTTAPDRK